MSLEKKWINIKNDPYGWIDLSLADINGRDQDDTLSLTRDEALQLATALTEAAQS